MATHQDESRIELTEMPQLAEAVDKRDDWTGVTDAAARRRMQNRLNVRAYRRRRAKEAEAEAQSTARRLVARHAGIDLDFSSADMLSPGEAPTVPCWIESQQRVTSVPAALALALGGTGRPLIPFPGPSAPNQSAGSTTRTAETSTEPSSSRSIPKIEIIFPLSADHLLTLLQYNVLRACITNRRLLQQSTALNHPTAPPADECTTSAAHICLALDQLPTTLPASLHPTRRQQTTPHEHWIDIVPHATWRDNLIRLAGSYDEDQLWSDTMGGLFEGEPAPDLDADADAPALLVWDPPWHPRGWEMSPAFWHAWRWTMAGCGPELLAHTNHWRRLRGQDPIPDCDGVCVCGCQCVEII